MRRTAHVHILVRQILYSPGTYGVCMLYVLIRSKFAYTTKLSPFLLLSCYPFISLRCRPWVTHRPKGRPGRFDSGRC